MKKILLFLLLPITVLAQTKQETINLIDSRTSTYTGAATITTVGTIATGTWNATIISPTKGGTGLASYSQGDMLYSSSTNVLSTLVAGSNGKFLQTSGSGANPTWVNPDPSTVVAGLLGSEIKGQTFGLEYTYPALSNFTLTSGQIKFQAVWLPVAQTLFGVKWIQNTAGSYTGDAVNEVALYTISAGTLTRVAVSSDSANTWKFSTASIGKRGFTAPYNAAPGLYWVGLLYHNSAQTTAPVIASAAFSLAISETMDFTNSVKLSATLSAQTSMPSSQAMSGLTGNTNYVWVGLY